MRNLQLVRRLAVGIILMVAAGSFAPRFVSRKMAKAQSAPAQDSTPIMIELCGVPNSIDLPLKTGQNHMITAVIRGPVPTAVWAARSADSRFAFPIPPTEERHYQFNLGDPALLLALRRTGYAGSFRIFVKSGTLAVAASPSISFALSEPPRVLYSAVGPLRCEPSEWVAPREVNELVVELDPPTPGIAPNVEIQNNRRAMKENSAGLFSLALTPEMRQSWEAAGILHNQCGEAMHRPNERAFRAIPYRWQIPDEGVSVSITVGETMALPASNGYVLVKCQDIKSDSARVELTLAGEKSDPWIKAGEVGGCFKIRDHQYMWGLGRVEDGAPPHVTVTAWNASAAERKMIALLPVVIGKCHDLELTCGKNVYPSHVAVQQVQVLIDRYRVTNLSELFKAIKAWEKEVGCDYEISRTYSGPEPLANFVAGWVEQIGWDLPSDAPTPNR